MDHRSCQLQAPSSSAAAVTSIGSLEDQFAPYAPRFAAHSSSPSPGHQDLYLCSTHAILCSLIFSPVPREHPIVHSSSSSSSPSRQREGRCYMGLKMFCIVKLYLLDIFVVFLIWLFATLEHFCFVFLQDIFFTHSSVPGSWGRYPVRHPQQQPHCARCNPSGSPFIPPPPVTRDRFHKLIYSNRH